MAEKIKLTPKKIVVKGPASKDTIAGKLSAQKNLKEQEQRAEADKAKTKEPQNNKNEAKTEKPAPPRPRTVFIQDERTLVSDYEDHEQRKPAKSAPEKKKSNLREDILRKEEHRKFFIGQKSKEKEKTKTEAAAPTSSVPARIRITEYVQVGELARKLNIRATELIAKLMQMGVMATITQSIDAETATLVAAEYNCQVDVVSLYEETLIQEEPDRPEDLVPRPPVVTVMGHVDHGKTKLLDALRQTDVAATEAGGITQHIGAYQVTRPKGKITFLDTPGHAAFSAMRARGAQITDIVVLVVAADDGVMPQTEEAISHARDAKVPIIVAINKIDKPNANIERIKQDLAKLDLLPEDWGGNTPYVPISALQKINLDKLEDTILTLAEVMELKANPNKRAVGTVVEAKLDHGRGPVATILVRNGTLRVGDPVVVGLEGGKIRAMYNDRGQPVKEAPPSTPVEILGLSGVPNSGDTLNAMASEREVREIVDKRQELARQQQAKQVRKVKLENLQETIEEGKIKEYKIIIKGDVKGSVEALTNALEKLSNNEVRVRVILGSTGEITESDIMLASAAKATIITFNVRANAKVRELAAREGVEIKNYNIIYQAIDDMKLALAGLLSPDISEQVSGEAEVLQIFKISGVGTVAGCAVRSGVIKRQNPVRVLREGVVVFTGQLKSLKRFKDDVSEVKEGFECGILIENFNDVKVGDVIESFEKIEKQRSLDDVGGTA
ncbi:MAG: translation initiation factor IF-2 [Turneriella sp.]|nr:translation initiation factor IF-2 [Leptospiraceae bacterium]MCX7632189.1 translation initiation factor IF-2 [Turneriella sp.]